MQIYSRYSRVETISGEPVPVREALAAINRAIADYDERQEGDLDAESRFCLDWLKQHGYEIGQYGEGRDAGPRQKRSHRQIAKSGPSAHCRKGRCTASADRRVQQRSPVVSR